MAIKKDIGFVLRAFDFRETSKIAHIFTRNCGKICGLFKGYRTGKKNFTTSLDIFSLNEIIFYESKNEIYLVSSADIMNNFSHLKGTVEKNIMASYMVELVDKVTALHHPSLEIFNLLNESLECLALTQHKKIIYIFQIKILELSGFKPHLTACVKCSREIQKHASFSVSLGGVLCGMCMHFDKFAKELSAELIASLKYVQNNDFKICLRLATSANVEKQILQVLEEFLGYHTDTKMKSLSLINAI